ncbi:GatB/YqeY domain-containing protein [Lacticigenium naphthae]|uniref:GatB/YqeY domain-containing protein n=1 Tax=Lacticigenium naphthae TaxID=515351 RepID=UPI000413B8D1|nr:GatB/YqeY domain-containing protein [Lacticigenium naphthae]
MSLVTIINDDLKSAMKARDKQKLSVLRMIKASLQNEQIKKGSELSEEEELAVVAREKKQRVDSKEEFGNAGRDDLVQQLDIEIKIVEEYLPEQLSEEEIRNLVQASINETGASSMKDMGKVMASVIPKTKGKADGKVVNTIVKEELSQ